MILRKGPVLMAVTLLFVVPALMAVPTSAADKKPNILFIMGDDIGWFNIGAYHRGIMSGKSPNLDKLASQGMMFTDYYVSRRCSIKGSTEAPRILSGS